MVERDLAPDTNDGDEAFLVWDRRNVPQFRQPHTFSARSRNLLLEHIPEAVDWLRADGNPRSTSSRCLRRPSSGLTRTTPTRGSGAGDRHWFRPSAHR